MIHSLKLVVFGYSLQFINNSPWLVWHVFYFHDIVR